MSTREPKHGLSIRERGSLIVDRHFMSWLRTSKVSVLENKNKIA